jgi:hypothetical protein
MWLWEIEPGRGESKTKIIDQLTKDIGYTGGCIIVGHAGRDVF